MRKWLTTLLWTMGAVIILYAMAMANKQLRVYPFSHHSGWILVLPQVIGFILLGLYASLLVSKKSKKRKGNPSIFTFVFLPSLAASIYSMIPLFGHGIMPYPRVVAEIMGSGANFIYLMTGFSLVLSFRDVPR